MEQTQPVQAEATQPVQAEATQPVQAAPVDPAVPHLTDQVPETAVLNIPDAPPQPTKFVFEVGDQRPEGFDDPQPPAQQQQAPAPAPSGPPAPPGTLVSEVHKRELVREQARADQLRAKIMGIVSHRNDAPAMPKPQPVPPAIAEQTRAEMDAGRRMNEHHAGLRSIAPRRIDPREGTTVPVFRPADFVPALTKSPVARNDAEQSRNV